MKKERYFDIIVFYHKNDIKRSISHEYYNYGCKYYQITAIDEFSRKRVLKIVKEKSTYETSKFMLTLEKNTTIFSMAKCKSGKKP